MKMCALERLCLALFLLSTPLSCYAVFGLGYSRGWVAIANSYVFSLAMLGLYVLPLLRLGAPAEERLHRATLNWIVWLSVFTEVVFQIPHNVFVAQLHAARGGLLEWPFFSYGLSDGRWLRESGGDEAVPEPLRKLT